MGRADEVVPQGHRILLRQALLKECIVHMGEPVLPGDRIDREIGVAHPEPGMAALIAVGGWPSPILRKEQAQPILGRSEVLVGVHRSHDRVDSNADIEGSYEAYEEFMAPEPFIGCLTQRGVGPAHCPIFTDAN